MVTMTRKTSITSGRYQLDIDTDVRGRFGAPQGFYFPHGVVEAVDPEYADLARQEHELGGRREDGGKWAPRGVDPEVDDLYDRLNGRYVETVTRVADEVLPDVLAAVDGTRVEPDGLRFDRHAGCSCPCTPGVAGLRGASVDVYLTDRSDEIDG